MRKLILDTSFLSSYLNKSDVNHEKALDVYAQIVQNEQDSVDLLVSVNVLIELLVGIKKLGKRKIKQVLEFVDVFADQVVDIGLGDIGEFGEYLDYSKVNITPIDQYLLFLAKKYDAEILTFDKELLRKNLAQN